MNYKNCIDCGIVIGKDSKRCLPCDRQNKGQSCPQPKTLLRNSMKVYKLITDGLEFARIRSITGIGKYQFNRCINYIAANRAMFQEAVRKEHLSNSKTATVGSKNETYYPVKFSEDELDIGLIPTYTWSSVRREALAINYGKSS